MKLLHATIYGFGKWVDHSIDFSNGSSVIIYGENESGKSTLQTFILFMLFGLPPRKRSFYRPKTSGKLGGRLTISDPDTGEITIERLDEVKNGAATCYTTDGKEYNEEWLKDKLQGMTYQTYQSIFSFSALDLNDFDEMTETDIGEILLGIGLTGSTNIYGIEKRLDAKIGELFKPYGKKPVLNQQIETLKRLSSSLQSLKEKESTYQEKKQLAADLDEMQAAIKKELEEKRIHLHTLEKQQHALPLLQRYQYEKKQLEGFPKTIIFPENGLERLEKQKELLLPLQSEYDVLKSNEKKYQEKLTNLKDQLKPEYVYKQAREIVAHQATYLADRKELEQTKANIEEIEMQINGSLDQLAIGLTREDLNELVFPFYIENTWNQLKNDEAQLNTEKEQLQEEETECKQERNYLFNQIQEAEDHLFSDDRLDELTEKVNTSKEDALIRKLQTEHDQKRLNWERMNQQEKKKRNTALLSFAFFGVIAGLLAFLTDTSWLYVVMIVLLLTGISQWVQGKRSAFAMEKLFQSEIEPKGTKSFTEEEIHQAEHLLDSHHKSKEALTSLEERLKANDIELIKWKERNNSFADKEKHLENQIQENQERYPFLLHVETSYWPELYHRLDRLLQLEGDLQTQQKKIEEIHQQLDIYERNVFQFTQDEQDLYSIADQLKWIESLLGEYESIKKQLQEYHHLREESVEKIEQVKQKMNRYEKEIKQLLDHAGVETVDMFYQQANRLKEKQEMEGSMEKIQAQLQAVFSEDTWKKWLEQSLNQQTLEWNHKQTKQQIEQLEHKNESVRGKLADVKAELKSMEASESYSESIQQFEMEQEQFQKLTREWSILKTAKEMLTDTKRYYREKYLNKVLDQTAYFFSILTGNQYKQVHAPANGTPFQVVTEEGIRYRVNQLSKGTMDQLYISLRLAISEIMSETHKLPFIIDDAFVHFDFTRTKRMMELLADISKRHQVILFTCKQEIVRGSKGMKTIDLEMEKQFL